MSTPNETTKESTKPSKAIFSHQNSINNKPDVGGTSTSAGASNNKGTNNDDKSSNNDKEDKSKRFEGEGVVFKAKLIGTELVMEPRGDKMCQNSIQRLKAIIKGQKAHKRRIVLKISYNGVKVYDEKTNEILHHHEVPQISFIASDDADNRAFGYVCDVPCKAHQFICFKTTGPAVQVMSVISGLFEAVLERKKMKEGGGMLTSVAEPSGAGAKSATAQQVPTTGSNLIDSNTGDKLEQSINNNENTSPFTTLDRATASLATTNKGKLSKIDSLTGDLDDLDFNISAIELGASTKQSAGSGAATQSKPFVGALDLEPAQTMLRNESGLVRQSTLNESSPIELITSDSGIMDSPSAISDWLPSPPQQAMPGQQQQQQQQGQYIQRKHHNPMDLSAAQQQNVNTQNRSLIYNHSSVSLNDAALTRQSSFNSSVQNDSTDKYAVFNDIDNLPSIFESTSSLGSTNKLSNIGGDIPSGEQNSITMNNMGHNQFTHNNNNISANASMGAFFGNDHQFTNQMSSNFVVPSHAPINVFFPNHSMGIPSRPGATPSMMVPISQNSTVGPVGFRTSSASSAGMIVGSAPMSGQQLSGQHPRLSSNMAPSLHKRLGSSAASVKSAGSAGGLSRQTNPFDDDFFA